MKTHIRQIIALAIIFALAYGGCVKAQSIIDTNYYRYTYSPFNHEYWSPVWAYDEVTGEGYVIDSVSMCIKDKFGYLGDIHSVEVHTNRYYYGYGSMIESYPDLDRYHRLPLPHDNMDIYGIAIFIDSIINFHTGDYLKMFVCRKSDDGTRFVKIDSVVLNEHTLGVKRFMNCPINMPQIYFVQYDTNNYPIPFEYCIGHYELIQVMEVYFENPVHITDSQLFWKIELFDNSSRFFFSFRHQGAAWNVKVYDYDCSYWGPGLSYDYMMAITEPLPQWEQSSMELLITDVIHDPDDPDDPDTPGGDEGIAEVDGGLQSAVSLRPNPSSGVTTVSCAEAITELTVRDMAGRVVLRKAACGSSTTFDTSTLRKGVYLVKVTTARGTVTKKLVVE